MNSGQTVFRQQLQFLPRHDFNLCVRRYVRCFARNRRYHLHHGLGVYIDSARLHTLHQKGAFFVIRVKDNLRFKHLYSVSASIVSVNFKRPDKKTGHGYPLW